MTSRYKFSPSTTFYLFFLILTLCLTVNGQTKSSKKQKCVQFSDLQTGALTAAQQQDAKFQVRKYLWESWEENKKTCAELTMHSTKGAVYAWNYSITIDRSRKKQLTVQFFDNGTLQSTQNVFNVRRWQNNPNYALELLDQNGKQLGIL